MSEQWDFYPSRVDGEPASIYVDLSHIDEAPRENAPDMVWLRLTMRAPREDGLSSQHEYEVLCDIEDTLVTAVEQADALAYFVGRNTSGGCRDFYFYSDKGHLVESTLGQAMVSFSDYEYETGHRPDPEWSAYVDFLYPTDRDMQLIKNQHVIQVLVESDG
jgi:uncharacterized protein (TIGR01619 family)